VLIAAEGAAAFLFKKEFPELTILPIRGYNITYSRQKKWLFAKMLLQVPKILSVIKYEKKLLQNIIRQQNIDIVISDNRFGLYNKHIMSVYITHQLFIETGNKVLNKIAQKVHYSYINKFTTCWVPDVEATINLAGKLAHPKTLPKVPVVYIGCLSRFVFKEMPHQNDLLILLSGPEPQRTIFENVLLKQIKEIDLNIAFVRGLPAEITQLKSENNKVKFYNHLSAVALNNLILQSKLIISRAGYSTIMDMVALQKNAVIVATPGQTEQAYLAKYLRAKKIFLAAEQNNFSLKQILSEAANFSFASIKTVPNFNKQAIIDLCTKAKTNL
jgi:UDP-N-acetylglucosamine transferase subunit ALG13